MKRIIKLHLLGIVGMIITLVLGIISLNGYDLYGLFPTFYYSFLIVGFYELCLIGYTAFHMTERVRKQLVLYGALYLIVLGGMVVLLYLIEWIFGLIFIYKFSYSLFYLVLIVYPASFWLLLFGLQLFEERVMKQVLTGLFVIGTFAVAFLHLVLIMLGGQTTTFVDFEDRDIELVLVESTFIFSSSHRLYEKTNPLFVRTVYSNGSWTCDDGCVTQNPDAYDWEWIDENTLVVSNDQMFDPVTFYFGD